MTFILNGAPSAHDTSDENSTRFHNSSDDQLSLKNVGKMSVCFSFLVLFGPEWSELIPGSIVRADSSFVGRKRGRITLPSFIWPALNWSLRK